MEMIQHRLVVTSLSQLLSELDQDSEGTHTLQAWIGSYSSKVTSVFPNFEKLDSWEKVPPDFDIVFDKNSIHNTRSKLMELVLEMVMLLAPGRFNHEGEPNRTKPTTNKHAV
ncbi:aminopeptidase N [Candidatus Scalindua japonica]|uniref:Aminopeptidase N n=2 Tax=Candidatus Scalindua japonica TaxID=1284222 RepID=A0A286TWW8_9BACT|nr:aminopeptidase N [Candidatus Scalindua japonica]